MLMRHMYVVCVYVCAQVFCMHIVWADSGGSKYNLFSLQELILQ
jgi:hypothetical protein